MAIYFNGGLMLKRIKLFLNVGIGCVGCAAVIGLAQANTLTPIATYKGNTTWQNIGGVSYTFTDTNHNGQINVGDTVVFTVDMQKQNWGTHAFDALKVWIDNTPLNPPSTTIYTNQFEWNFDPTHNNQQYFGQQYDPYSYRPWTGGDKYFSFAYTFQSAGVFDLTASVMCSRDLSGLVGSANDSPTSSDWNAWNENVHQINPYLQGETDRYQLTVASPVPEPRTYAMMLAGLGLMGFMVRRRKSLES